MTGIFIINKENMVAIIVNMLRMVLLLVKPEPSVVLPSEYYGQLSCCTLLHHYDVIITGVQDNQMVKLTNHLHILIMELLTSNHMVRNP